MAVTRTNAVTAAAPHTTDWSLAVVSIGIAWALIFAAYGDAFVAMVFKWYESGTFAHGFLIPGITAFLVWRERGRWMHLRPAPSGWALAALPAAGFMWLIGELGDILVVQQFAFIAMLELVVWAILGSKIVRALLFPLAFFWFAVPVGEFLVSPLQDFTAWFAVGGLRLSGIPVLWEGRSIRVPSGDWLVAEACSGVRYVIPSVVLGVLYAAITYRSLRRRLAFVVLAFLVPILANGIRAYVIIMLAHLTANRIAVGVDHLIYGWVFFGFVMFLLFLIGGRWREGSAKLGRQGLAGSAADSRGESGSGGRSQTPGFRALNAISVTVSVFVLVLLPASLSATLFAAPEVTASEIGAPGVTQPWQAVNRSMRWRPRFVGADAEGAQIYAAGDYEVQWYLAYYAKEQQGAELISSENHVGGSDKEWVETSAEDVVVRLDGETGVVHEQLLKSQKGEKRLVWTWYWVGGGYTANPYYAKLLRVKTRLLGSEHGAAVVVVASDHHPDVRTTLQDFLDHCAPMGTLLRGVSSRKESEALAATR